MKKIIFIIIVLAISSILYSQYYDSYDIGKWNLVEKIDPITDEKEISLSPWFNLRTISLGNI